MAEAKTETTNNVAESEELRGFYRALAAVQTNSIFRVMSAEDEEQMKRRAVEVTNHLVKIANANGGEKCGNGTIWNPITGRCE